MSDQALMLLVERDERAIQAFRATLEVERRVRLVVAPTGEEGLRIARELKPDLIVIAHDARGLNALSLCQQVRQDATLQGSMLVMVIDRGANDMRFAGLTFGVDEYLTRPVEPAEVLTKVHGMLRLKKANDAIRADQAELKQLHESLRASFDQLLHLMARMLDMRLPGAADRGQRIAELARKVADRFGVPSTHLADLEIAARLNELGRVVAAPGQAASSASTHRGADDWKYVVGTRAILSQVDGLAGAAELVGATFENWDGSGHPDHLQLGQIPLRSRILRVLVDLFAELTSPRKPSMDDALEHLQNHVGTLYDPMVMVHLRAVLQDANDSDVRGKRVTLQVPDLQVGMVLAEDLCTDGGLKLLARHTRLTSETLEVIRRRHASEPLTNGAAVVREPAA